VVRPDRLSARHLVSCETAATENALRSARINEEEREKQVACAAALRYRGVARGTSMNAETLVTTRMGRRLVRLLLPAVLLAAAGAHAEPPAERLRLRIPRVDTPPKLEDFLNGTPRQAEAVVSDFTQFYPNDGAPASQEAWAFLSYDDKNLYVGWICRDDPAKIRANLMKRDNLLDEDRVSISIDTFHDHRRSYWFDTNPYGVQMDGMTVDGVDQLNFDTLWYSEGRLTPDGYVVLQTIPFKSLRFPSTPRQEWGFVVNRVTMRSGEITAWPPMTSKVSGWTTQFGHLDGIENVSQGRNVQFIPYGLFAGARNLDRSSAERSTYVRTNDPRGGIDAKVVVKDALTVDATVNPDFSQVESDEPQVTVNQRYEVYFPEKRPFFLENANLFETPTQLFFSRRIADPQVGLRLSGKKNRWAMGLLASDERAAGATLPETDPQHGDRAAIGVFRLQRELGRESRVGIFGSTREFGSSFNRVCAADTRVMLAPNWHLTLQWMGSSTGFADGRHTAGTASLAQVSRYGKHFGLTSYYRDRSGGFQTALGYIPRVDIREIGQNVHYWFRPVKKSVLRYGPYVDGVAVWSMGGKLLDWEVEPGFEIELTRQTYVTVERSEAYELFKGIGFRKGHTLVSAGSEVLRWLGLSGSGRLGTNVNYYPPPGHDPFLANWTEATLGLTLRPTAQLVFEGTYLYTRLRTRRAGGAGPPSGARIFDDHVLRSRVNLQLSRELSVRAIVDWKRTNPDDSLVALENVKRLGVDVLVAYLVHPGTALYLGYTDYYENLSLDPTASPLLRRTSSPGASIGRQVFVKLSYLLRM
jgi:hypothetical protein